MFFWQAWVSPEGNAKRNIKNSNMNDNWRAAICVGVSLSKQNLEWKGFSNEPAKKRETSSRITVGSCLESMLNASTRAKTTPPAHYQQFSQMSICPLFLIFPFKNCSESCWGGYNAWQVITEQSRAEAPLGISSNSGSCWKLALHEGCRRSLPAKPIWGTLALAQLCWEGWVSTNDGMPTELLTCTKQRF